MLLPALFFLFRLLPWTKGRTGRTLWLFASLAALMFIVGEAYALVDPGASVAAPPHQAPLFGAMLAAVTGVFLAYMEARRIAERAETLALTDPLTTLSNRRAFEARLSVAMERHEPFSLVYVDLDGFKRVNDTLGHQTGDTLLKDAADVFRQAARRVDVAARLGGDEFALLLVGADPKSARVVTERLLRGVRALSDRLPDGLRVGASFGVATHADARNPHGLVEAADSAMYRAKRAGGNRIAFADQPILIELSA